ncbi:MAG: sugar transferase [Clostridiales bacterium]|nr:sugar transferase [Clostridiales bacterium]
MGARRRIQKTLEFYVGLISIILANTISYLIFGIIIDKIVDYSLNSWLVYIVEAFLSYFIVFTLFYVPMNLVKRSRSLEFVSTTRNSILTYVFLAAIMLLTKNEILESRYLFISGFILFLFFSLIGRYVLKRYLLGRVADSKLAIMTGVISTYSRAKEFIPKLKVDWSKNVKAIALLDAEYEDNCFKRQVKTKQKNGKPITTLKKVEDVDGVPVVANKENLLGWIRTASLDEVYINLPNEHDDYVDDIVEELEDMGIVVYINIPSMERRVNMSKYNNFDCIVKSGYPMAVLTPALHNNTSLIIKRILDIIGGLVGTIVSLPIILLTAIPLKIESPGPLIFKQQRVGKNGRIFNIYKLRSMYVDAEERKKNLMEENKMDGHMFKMDDDPRITKVGKFIRKYSIDELPQFWNVLKGDMSLVGTRPPTIDEFEEYESHHKRRLSLKPGITGMWQVSGRSDIHDFEEIVRLDCEYIDNFTIMLDIQILFKTVGVVLRHKGAN